MKQAFRKQRITPKRMEQISVVNEILDEYSDQGYRLTLRQLYYQMVARGIIDNLSREYNRVMATCTIGRMGGLIDWNMIEDRVRKPDLPYAVDSIQEAIEDTIKYYKLNRQMEQPYNIEVWTEKDAVSNILKRVSHYYHMNLMINRGYSSVSAMYEAYRRMYGDMLENDRKTILLYVGDHDPSGLDMLRDIRERLDEFGVEKIEVVPVALTKEQIGEYDPPPNPAKINDPRADWYIDSFGEESWELDALPPEVLHEIVNNAVLEYLDANQFNGMLELEQEDKKKLKQMLKKL